MRGRLWLLLFSAAMLARSALAGPPTTAHLAIGPFTCSGTIVAPSVVLSAMHCFEDEEDSGLPLPPPTTMMVDGYKVNIVAIVSDENDHALVKVDFVFKSFAKIAPVPVPGSRVHYWGNPSGLRDVYREGYITGYHRTEMMLDMNGFFGDSGAGIFNADGNVVGVISYIHVKSEKDMTFRLMGAAALEFTPLQYSMTGVTPP